MTKKILLALALTLGTAALTTPPAFACGGYGAALETPEERAVRETLLARMQPRVEDGVSVWVTDVVVTERDRATARLVLARGDSYRAHQVELRQRGGEWRILRFS